jgi:putative protease
MIEHIPEMVDSGVSSLKIEGRMKSAYYVAVVTRIYRQALDAYCGDPRSYRFLPEWTAELAAISHRPYTTGFYFGETDRETVTDSAYSTDYDFIATVEDYDRSSNILTVIGRNHFKVGDEAEIIDPHELAIKRFAVRNIRKNNG